MRAGDRNLSPPSESFQILRLSSIGDEATPFPLPHGRGDEFHHGRGGYDARDKPKLQPRDIFVPDLHIETLKVRPRNFR
jgi:error-prone DNA polymerase